MSDHEMINLDEMGSMKMSMEALQEELLIQIFMLNMM